MPFCTLTAVKPDGPAEGGQESFVAPVLLRMRWGTTKRESMMPTGQEQLFEDFVHFAATHGSGAVYQRDLHQSVPPGCVFVRFRAPGEGSFTFAGIVQFRQREEGFAACQTFVASCDIPNRIAHEFPP
jgi:hypothetical protein